jgi:hypothetical protein
MKMAVADGSLRCGHYSISRMLKQEAIVVVRPLLYADRLQGDAEL